MASLEYTSIKSLIFAEGTTWNAAITAARRHTAGDVLIKMNQTKWTTDGLGILTLIVSMYHTFSIQRVGSAKAVSWLGSQSWMGHHSEI